MAKDKIIRSTGEVIEVRFVLVDCTETANQIGKMHNAKAFALKLLGETITSSLLLASGLKYKGAVQISFNFSGDISHVEATGTPMGHVRAKMSPEEIKKVKEFDLMLSEQFVNVKKFNDTGGKIMDSTIEMPSKEISASLATFLLQSEQTRSAIGINAEVSENPDRLNYCAGFLIELFPKAKQETIQHIESAVKNIGDMGKFYKAGQYDLVSILEHLSGPYAYQIHREIPVEPFCPCSLNRVKKSLSTIPEADIKEMIEEGGAEIFCDYCRTRYKLNPEDLRGLLKL